MWKRVKVQNLLLQNTHREFLPLTGPVWLNMTGDNSMSDLSRHSAAMLRFPTNLSILPRQNLILLSPYYESFLLHLCRFDKSFISPRFTTGLRTELQRKNIHGESDQYYREAKNLLKAHSVINSAAWCWARWHWMRRIQCQLIHAPLQNHQRRLPRVFSRPHCSLR